ncbi:MAG TPA: tetratricopeptide repeat protein, partial [bacterium]
LLAKPMPVTLPLLLLLLEWWPLGRWSPLAGAPPGAARPWAGLLPPPSLWGEKSVLLALAGASAAVTLAVQAAAGAMDPAAAVPLSSRAANAAVACAVYLRRAIWPADLAAFYPYPWAGHPAPAVAGALAALGALVAVSLRQGRRRPWLAVGLLWFLVSLLPVIGLVQVGEQAMADRYTYLPLLGPGFAAAWWLAARAGRGRRQARAVAGASLAVVLALAVLAARQVGTWRDGVTLFSQAVAVTKDNHIGQNNLGTALLARGEAAAALPHFAETVRIAPHSPKGFQNAGRALAQLGRHAEAVDWYRQAIARDPRDPLARRNLGRSLEALGRREEAVAAYRESLALEPRDARTLDLLGVALARSGRTAEAVQLLEEAAALDPGNASVRDHLAVARAQRAVSPSAGRP